MDHSKDLSYAFCIRITRKEKCFGPGIARLLIMIDQTRSLRKATLEMQISYSKAWNMIKECEDVLGYKLLNTTTGGKDGGGAQLTPEARQLLMNYNNLIYDADKALQELFFKYFPPESGTIVTRTYRFLVLFFPSF